MLSFGFIMLVKLKLFNPGRILLRHYIYDLDHQPMRIQWTLTQLRQVSLVIVYKSEFELFFNRIRGIFEKISQVAS